MVMMSTLTSSLPFVEQGFWAFPSSHPEVGVFGLEKWVVMSFVKAGALLMAVCQKHLMLEQALKSSLSSDTILHSVSTNRPCISNISILRRSSCKYSSCNMVSTDVTGSDMTGMTASL